jgi:N-acetylglucosaminyldiphosphoundecaprenol N-acetyl-beta-D-mannosaminyltransferase
MSHSTHNLGMPIPTIPQLAMLFNRSTSIEPDYPSLNIHLLGRKITCLTIEAIQEAIALSCKRQQQITVANYNVHAFNLSLQLPWFHSFLDQSEITHCDGIGIIKALQFLGLDVPSQYRVSYTELMPELLAQCDRQGWSVFLLGTKATHIEAAIQNLEQDYPNATFAGHHGYFSITDQAENDLIIEQINTIRPNILIVGMGMPVQESWVQLYRDRLKTNAILVGGAVIDRLAGVVTDCPAWISRLGLEWLYRFVREPKRLAARYLIGNPAFLFQIALAKFQRLTARNSQSVWCRPISIEELLAESPYLDRMPIQKKRIGEYLVDLGLIGAQDMELALDEQLHTGERLGTILANRKLINQQTVDELVEKLIQVNRRMTEENQPYVLGNTVDFLTEQLVTLEAQAH